jgi:uncharacterized membrane protein YgcG
MDYYDKYLKYKNKYLELKNKLIVLQFGGLSGGGSSGGGSTGGGSTGGEPVWEYDFESGGNSKDDVICPVARILVQPQLIIILSFTDGYKRELYELEILEKLFNLLSEGGIGIFYNCITVYLDIMPDYTLSDSSGKSEPEKKILFDKYIESYKKFDTLKLPYVKIIKGILNKSDIINKIKKDNSLIILSGHGGEGSSGPVFEIRNLHNRDSNTKNNFFIGNDFIEIAIEKPQFNFVVIVFACYAKDFITKENITKENIGVLQNIHCIFNSNPGKKSMSADHTINLINLFKQNLSFCDVTKNGKLDVDGKLILISYFENLQYKYSIDDGGDSSPDCKEEANFGGGGAAGGGGGGGGGGAAGGGGGAGGGGILAL